MVRWALGRKDNPSLSNLWRIAVFLTAFVLASINLWFVLPIHIVGSTLLMGTSRVYAARRDVRLDRRTLELTQNYKGAVNFIEFTRTDRDQAHKRLDALQQTAEGLGLTR